MGWLLVLFSQPAQLSRPPSTQTEEMSLAESMDNNHKDDINTQDDEAGDDEHNTTAPR